MGKATLTLDAIARFAQGRSAPYYAAMCREYGLDPAEGISDPFMAMQLRAALLWQPPAEDDGEQHRARVDASREAANKLRGL